jgi:hypothetical protein
MKRTASTHTIVIVSLLALLILSGIGAFAQARILAPSQGSKAVDDSKGSGISNANVSSRPESETFACLAISCPGSDPDWAIGATSTDTGVSSETTDWANLASSYTMTGITKLDFLLDVPFSAGGTLTCNSNGETITGILFQLGDRYNASNTHETSPTITIAFFTSTGSGVYYYGYEWYGTNLGAGPIYETISYTTYNSVTGWWAEISNSANSYYLMAITTSGFSFYTSGSTTHIPCGTTSLSISSLGSTSSAVTHGTYTFDPSIAMEVEEDTSGHIFTDNSALGVYAAVTTDEFYDYANYTTSGFNIGGTSPPKGTDGANASGFTQWTDNNHVSVKYYYDVFGSATGVSDTMNTEFGVSGAILVKTTGTNLPGLNVVCTGNDCPLVRTGTSVGLPRSAEVPSTIGVATSQRLQL